MAANEYATVSEFRAMVDPFDASITALSDALVQLYLDCAAHMISIECWGDKTNCGSIYLAAHLLSSAAGSESGPLTNRKIGDISAGYATAVVPTTDLLAGTHWGRMYLTLYDTVFSAGTTGGTLAIGIVC